MSLIVNKPIDDIYNIVCSKHFIYKIYLLKDKDCIIEKNNDYIFKRIYNYKDLDKIINIVNISENISNIVNNNLNNLNNINLLFETSHQIIKKNDREFIVKYTSIILEPSYISQILTNTKIILYVQFTKNTKDNNMTVIHFNKKLVNSDDKDDDSIFIDLNNNDIITNIYQQDKLNINDNLILLSETLFGQNMVQNMIIPTINTVFKTAFDVLQDVYTIRFIKYMSKKNIEIYKKK